MGLIKAAAAAISGTMDDIWKEMFVCDSLPSDILMVRGVKRVSNRSANTGGDPNTITHGSVIVISEGQCALVVSGGKVIDSCALPGEYVFHDPKHVPGLGGLLAEAGERFTFGGDPPPKMQRVYYVNVKESMNNPFSTTAPIRLRAAGGYPLYGTVACSGLFSYRIADPALFYKLVAGNVAGAYTRRELTSQITSELLTALGPAMDACCSRGIRPSEIPAHTEELCRALRDSAGNDWLGQRGIEISSVAISRFSPLGGDMAEAQRMSRAATLFGMPPEEETKEEAETKAEPEAWNCVLCGAESTGDFCPQCGKPRKWTCACGKENLGKFCRDCGKPRQ